MRRLAPLLVAFVAVIGLPGCDEPSKPPGMQTQKLGDAQVDGVTIRELVAKVRGLEARVQQLESK